MCNNKEEVIKLLKELSERQQQIAENVTETPLQEALSQFRDENGYGYLDVVTNSTIKKRHEIRKMLERQEENDNDFLNAYQYYQSLEKDE